VKYTADDGYYRYVCGNSVHSRKAKIELVQPARTSGFKNAFIREFIRLTHQIVPENTPLYEYKNIKLRALEPEDLELLYQWENNDSYWLISNTVSPFSDIH